MSTATLWGGVFGTATNDLAWRLGQSLASDMNLLDEEVEVSIAHAHMLAACGIVSADEGEALVEGLEQVRAGLATGKLALARDAEDIHSVVESLLIECVGPVAKKLHSGRSRNDQIATVTRLWLLRRMSELDGAIAALQATLVSLAKKHRADPCPGYTHQQPGQPLTLGHALLAWFWMVDRDRQRIAALSQLTGECPLGSGALGGTSLPIDRALTAASLGFARPMANSLDAVSDRDFVGDALHLCATLMQHLSRFAQEIVLGSTSEFGSLALDESYSTGSSLMPQKRNPDFAELIRGRAGKAIGNWVSFMSLMKGLPLGYNRDQQDDKPPLFESVRLCLDSVVLVDGMLATATFDVARLASLAGQGHSTATGVAEELVAEGVPFREAHEVVGKAVRAALSRGKDLDELVPDDLPPGMPASLTQALKNATVAASLANRVSEGSPGPAALTQQIELAACRLQTPLTNPL